MPKIANTKTSLINLTKSFLIKCAFCRRYDILEFFVTPEKPACVSCVIAAGKYLLKSAHSKYQIHRPNYSVGNGSRREKVLTEPRMYGRSLTIPPVAPFFRARHRTINIVWLLLLVVWVNETVDRLESRLKPREVAVRKSSDTSGIAENAAVRNTD